jgi:hypothetical protein
MKKGGNRTVWHPGRTCKSEDRYSFRNWLSVVQHRFLGEVVKNSTLYLGGVLIRKRHISPSQVGRSRDPASLREKGALKNRIIREMCKKEGVGEGELRMGGQARRVSRVRSKIAWSLSRGYGFSLAEIARELGVCASANEKAVRKTEEKN